jgi:hypothetical protein
VAKEWLTKNKDAIKTLTDERQDSYRQIREMSAHPLDVELVLYDQEIHMGAADVVIDQDNMRRAEGVYWTRRMWTAGLNTAGQIELWKLVDARDNSKTLTQYAVEAHSQEFGKRN